MSNTKKEQFEFQSEVKQLLNILVYSLYKNKEVFLRELISNAVDALNKVRFKLLTDKDLPDTDLDLKIEIGFNNTRKTIVIEDTGIGMT
ncbi:MAG: molecular chaperone HtpG, partial [Acidobacteria bacterium]|nr:molecular chaperone HtpG [Acidobacteriota bacterium]